MPFRELLREYPGIPRIAPRMAFSLRERFFQNWGGSQVSEKSQEANACKMFWSTIWTAFPPCLSTFCASFFPLFFPLPTVPFLPESPPLPRTSKLIRFLEEMQYSGAGVRRGFWRGSPHRKRRNFLKKWCAKIGQLFSS